MSSTYKWKQCHNYDIGSTYVDDIEMHWIAHKRTSQPKSITYKQNGLSTHSRRKTILEKK